MTRQLSRIHARRRSPGGSRPSSASTYKVVPVADPGGAPVRVPRDGGGKPRLDSMLSHHKGMSGASSVPQVRPIPQLPQKERSHPAKPLPGQRRLGEGGSWKLPRRRQLKRPCFLLLAAVLRSGITLNGNGRNQSMSSTQVIDHLRFAVKASG